MYHNRWQEVHVRKHEKCPVDVEVTSNQSSRIVMIALWLLCIYIAVFLYILYDYCTYRPPNFPPGPPRIPIFGSYLFLLLIDKKNLHLAVLKLCKWYNTKVLGFYIGNTPTIVANDYDSVREILFNQAFDGRPDIYIARLRDPDHEKRGIFFTDGPQWKEQRRFTLRHLRDYGFGRRMESLEIEIRDEIKEFIDIVRNGPKYDHEKEFFKGNGLVNCPSAFFMCFGNCFLQVLLRDRIPRNEQHTIAKAGVLGLLFQRTADDYGKLLSVIPWIRFFLPKSSGYSTFKRTNSGLYEFMKPLVDKQLETFNPNREERHFLDLYFKEMKNIDYGKQDKQLILTCIDFFFPALTAIGMQTSFLFEICFKNPEIKTKIQQEIDEIVGQNRFPTLDDRIHMPYTEACIRELLRYETLVPSSIPHKAMHDTLFQGFNVPKGCFMVPGLYAMHFDENKWKDPKTFKPERFLDVNGQLSLKKDISLPFGGGKRLCAGETFARNALFLFITAIFQNFDFKLEDGVSVDELIKNNHTGLSTSTPDFWLNSSSKVMIALWLLCIYIAVFLYILYDYCTYRPPNFPPGPPRIPIFGSYLFLLLIDKKNLHLAVLKLCKWYNTKVLGFYIGNTPTIVANDYETFDGRPDIYIARMRDPDHEKRGIFFLDGPQWKEQRRFTLRHLRDYGFGRRMDSLENEIRDEISEFISIVKNGPQFDHEKQFFRGDGFVNCPSAFFMCLGNCFLQVLLGERLPREEQHTIARAGILGILFQRTADDYGKLLSVAPWIRFFFPEASGYNIFKRTNKGLYAFMKNLIDKQLKTFDPEKEERHFLDLYFKEMQGLKDDKEEGYYYKQLILGCLDFFFPALTALGAQTTFLFEICLKNPKIKDKIQQEIDDVVGQGRLPNLDDQACIRELLRYETLVPSSIPHKAMYDTMFQGYFAPKGCNIIASLYAMHFDDKKWTDPHTFRPERFLDMKGELSLKKDISLPFGGGKRLCAGETFARNALFLFITAIFQSFDFELENGVSVDDLIAKNETGLITSTPDFWLKFKARPPRIPFVGSYFFLLLVNSQKVHMAILKLCKWYNTKVLGFYIGDCPTIVANDYDSVREILFNQDFDGRPEIFVAKMRDPDLESRGIFFVDGPIWKEQRRFTLRHLRDFGFGRRFETLENEIRDEISTFINLIREGPKYEHEEILFRPDGLVHCPKAFFTCFGNCSLQVLFGERFPRHEQHILAKAGELGILFQRTGSDYGRLLSIIPWIRHFFPETCGYNKFKEADEGLYKFMKVKKKIQCEIDEVVGQGRLPNLDDRVHMPYTEACLRELMRYETLAPSSLPHRALHDTTFQGYTVPKNCLMIASLYALHFDEKKWTDAHNFRPERFLDMKGQLSLKKDISLPFGGGKRLCAGETFARNTMFLFLTAIFQNFDFELKEGTCVEKLIKTIIVVLLLYRAFKWSTYKPPGFPPGPPRIPFVGGYLFFLLLNKDRLHLAALTFSKWYKSKYIGFWWGDSLITVINDYKGIKESFNRTEFDGKPVTYTVLMREPHEQVRGIFFLEGPMWKAQRWFMLRYMRDFGFGRRHENLECHIRDELMSFIDQIRNGPKYDHEYEFFDKNQCVNVPLGMAACLVNCFFQVIISERFPREEQGALFEVAKHSLAFQRNSDSYARLLSVIPWIRHLFPEKSGYNILRQSNQGLYNFMKKFIDKQLSTYDENHQRHFLDMYIKEMKKSDSNQDFSKGFFCKYY
uniref:CSON013586 protein n=1 Tax=Culicoides sonorensis TaxID=179676 RepID=A0A336KN19_CULSO